MITIDTTEILGFRDSKLLFGGIVIVSMMMNLMLFGEQFRCGEVNQLSKCQVMSLMYTTFFWLLFRQVYIEIIKRYGGGYENIRKRYMIAIPLFIILFVVIKLLLDVTVDKYLVENYGVLKPSPVLEIIGSFIFLALMISIYEGTHLLLELKESQLEKEQLIKENISSQLEGLKNQVNPHFLFNSLNTLASIIPEDQEKSIRFVSKLSKVYRYILEIKDKKLVSVAEELKFLRSYTFLLEERFGDNINVDIDLPEDVMNKNIVPLSLQITFENAIKHNIISRKLPLTIRAYLNDDGCMVIENNLQIKNSVGVSPGMGLLNIKNRYKFFTKEEVSVVKTDEKFAVVLPLLRPQKNKIS